MTEPKWIKASDSGVSACVEAVTAPGGVALRDSKDPTGPRLHFTRSEFQAFLAGAKAGEFDHLAGDEQD